MEDQQAAETWSPEKTRNETDIIRSRVRKTIEQELADDPYVILHELCHLVEHNHSKRFFDLLTKKMPAWESAKRELDSLAELILADSGSAN